MPRELIKQLQDFRDSLLAKSADDRTPREQLLIESCRTVEDQLRLYIAGHAAPSRPGDDSALVLFRSLNEVNREYDLRDAEIDLAAKLRKGTRGHGAQ